MRTVNRAQVSFCDSQLPMPSLCYVMIYVCQKVGVEFSQEMHARNAWIRMPSACCLLFVLL